MIKNIVIHATFIYKNQISQSIILLKEQMKIKNITTKSNI